MQIRQKTQKHFRSTPLTRSHHRGDIRDALLNLIFLACSAYPFRAPVHNGSHEREDQCRRQPSEQKIRPEGRKIRFVGVNGFDRVPDEDPNNECQLHADKQSDHCAWIVQSLDWRLVFSGHVEPTFPHEDVVKVETCFVAPWQRYSPVTWGGGGEQPVSRPSISHGSVIGWNGPIP